MIEIQKRKQLLRKAESSQSDSITPVGGDIDIRSLSSTPKSGNDKAPVYVRALSKFKWKENNFVTSGSSLESFEESSVAAGETPRKNPEDILVSARN